MGLLTLEQFRSDSQFRSQRTIIDTALLDRLINQSILDVAATDIPFPELDKVQSLPLVVSQIEYGLPSDWYFYRRSGGRITGPEDEDRARILPMTRSEYLGKTDYDTDARPKRYLQDHGVLIVYQSPDKTYPVELDYRARPVAITAGQVAPLPNEWDEAVTLFTIAKIYQALQEHEKFLVAQNDAISYVRKRTPQPDQEKMSPTPLGVAWGEDDLQ